MSTDPQIEQSKKSEEPVAATPNGDRFDVELVCTHLERSVVDETDVDLLAYIEAYEELNKFIGMLGHIFHFVQADVRSKTTALRSLRVENPEKYSTVSTMVRYEVTFDPKEKKRGIVSLLHLHRAFDFIVAFIDGIGKAKPDDSVSEICRKTYDATLAKHHAWLIRKTVGVASYTLPSRRNLILAICETEPSEDHVRETLGRLARHGSTVYEKVHKYYDEHDLHKAA